MHTFAVCLMLGTNLEKKERGRKLLLAGENSILVYNTRYLSEVRIMYFISTDNFCWNFLNLESSGGFRLCFQFVSTSCCR